MFAVFEWNVKKAAEYLLGERVLAAYLMPAATATE